MHKDGAPRSTISSRSWAGRQRSSVCVAAGASSEPTRTAATSTTFARVWRLGIERKRYIYWIARRTSVGSQTAKQPDCAVRANRAAVGCWCRNLHGARSSCATMGQSEGCRARTLGAASSQAHFHFSSVPFQTGIRHGSDNEADAVQGINLSYVALARVGDDFPVLRVQPPPPLAGVALVEDELLECFLCHFSHSSCCSTSLQHKRYPLTPKGVADRCMDNRREFQRVRWAGVMLDRWTQ